MLAANWLYVLIKVCIYSFSMTFCTKLMKHKIMNSKRMLTQSCPRGCCRCWQWRISLCGRFSCSCPFSGQCLCDRQQHSQYPANKHTNYSVYKKYLRHFAGHIPEDSRNMYKHWTESEM